MAVLDSPADDPVVSAEAQLDTLTRLADDLAHEIKNPLHAAVINLEVLRRRMARLEGGEEAVRVAEIVGAELDRVARRVELLLKLARPDRGQPVRADAVIAEVAETLELVATHRRIAFTHRGGTGARQVTGPAEPLRLRLLAGAIQVMEREDVRALVLEVGGSPEAPVAALTGSDASGAPVGEPLEIDLLDPGRAPGLSS